MQESDDHPLVRELADEEIPQAESSSYLDDLFDEMPAEMKNYSETLGDKLDRVLYNQKTLFSNQKVIFSFMSQLLKDVRNISKSLDGMGVGLGVGGQEGGIVKQNRSSSVCRDQNTPSGSSENVKVGGGEGAQSPSSFFSWDGDETGFFGTNVATAFSVGGSEGGLAGTTRRGEFSVGSDGIQQCSETELEGENDSFLGEAMKVKSESCSMGNFAVKLIQRVFTPDQLDPP